jgi:hypothetical protein
MLHKLTEEEDFTNGLRAGSSGHQNPAAGRWLLSLTDLLGLQTLRSTLYYKRDACTFVEGAIPARLNRRKMDKYVLPVLALDKPKSFGSVKPLHRTGFFHVSHFPS